MSDTPTDDPLPGDIQTSLATQVELDALAFERVQQFRGGAGGGSFRASPTRTAHLTHGFMRFAGWQLAAECARQESNLRNVPARLLEPVVAQRRAGRSTRRASTGRVWRSSD